MIDNEALIKEIDEWQGEAHKIQVIFNANVPEVSDRARLAALNWLVHKAFETQGTTCTN